MFKKKLLVGLLMAAGTVFASVRVGIVIGAPPPPRVVRVRPPVPGPGYTWVTGYWIPVQGHYRWHSGYWARAPYAGGYWVAPRYEHGRYYGGYWARRHRAGVRP
jgi:hypothetical protein